MKKSILLFVIAISLLSCKKESNLTSQTTIVQPPTLPPTIPHPKQTIVTIPNYIKTVQTNGNKQNFTFTGTTLTMSILKANDTLSNIYLYMNGKTLQLVGIQVAHGTDTSYKIKSPTGLLYHSFNNNAIAGVTNFVVTNEIPFAVLGIPVMPIRSCIKAYFDKCYSNFWCSITLGSTMILASAIGAPIGCALGLKP